jgi:hypothetical protein
MSVTRISTDRVLSILLGALRANLRPVAVTINVLVQLGTGRAVTPADAVPLLSVIEKIKYLASLEPTELATTMDVDEGASLAQVETEPVELKSLLHPWNAIRRASPEQLTDEQYDAFLKGEHPIAAGMWRSQTTARSAMNQISSLRFR